MTESRWELPIVSLMSAMIFFATWHFTLSLLR